MSDKHEYTDGKGHKFSVRYAPPYPWDGEPERLEFSHAGFKCKVLRMPDGGHLNGYVYVTDHPDILSLPWVDVDKLPCHGGITGSCGEGWIGFDCGHCDDTWPSDYLGHLKTMLKGDYEFVGREAYVGWLNKDTYRDLAYVRKSTEGLAEALQKAWRKRRTSPVRYAAWLLNRRLNHRRSTNKT